MSTKKYITTIGVSMVATAASMILLYFIIFDSSGPPSEFEQRSISSEHLNESRSYLVSLPDGYAENPDRRYPVLYVLGGSSLAFQSTRDASLMARIGVMPEVIVVNVPNPDDAARQRDYTPPFMLRDLDEEDSKIGAADQFLVFLERELIPEINRSYRTSSVRMIAGHSRGGLFVMYALMENPTVFQAHLALSPALWRENDLFVSRFADHLASGPESNTFVFLSLGAQENEKMTRGFQKAVASLQENALVDLRWHAEKTPGANHGNNAATSMPIGLHQFFNDCIGESGLSG